MRMRRLHFRAVFFVSAIFCGISSQISVAKDNSSDDLSWGQWRALSGGYVARRREPARHKLPRNERRGENVAAVLTPTYASASATAPATRQLFSSRTTVGSAALTSAAASSLNDTPISAAWIKTGPEGLYSVSVPAVAETLGQSESKVRKKAKSGAILLTRGKKVTSQQATFPVSWIYDESADAILFPAMAFETFHTSENAFRLRLGNSDSRFASPMLVSELIGDGGLGYAEAFRDNLTWEEEPDMLFGPFFIPDTPDADYWFWDYLYAGSQDELALSLEIPNPAPSGTASLRVRLHGFTALEGAEEHQVWAEVNGQVVGSAIWGGMVEEVLEADFDQSILNEAGNNTLVLRIAYDQGSTPGQYLNDIELSYDRLPVAASNELWLHDVTGGRQQVGGFTTNALRVIESPAGESVLIEGALIEEDGLGGYSVNFDTIAGLDYLVVANAVNRTPAVVADYKSTLRKAENAADYLVIAPREFSGTAHALADYRAGTVGSVRIAWLDDIYDEYSAGRIDPAALGRFIKRVQSRWTLAPENVVLIGKGSLDGKDRMGYGDGFMPIVLAANPFGAVSSDSRLLGYEGTPPFGIGRIPITSDSVGLAYVDKVIAHETRVENPEGPVALLAADNPDAGGDFPAYTGELALHLQNNLGFSSVTTVYHPLDDVPGAMADLASWETSFINYQGHGALTQLGTTTEGFLNRDGAASLSNTQFPLFSAMTCAVGDVSFPGEQSLLSAIVLNPAGGAVAAVAPSGLSFDAQAQRLGSVIVEQLFADRAPMGVALREAKIAVGTDVETFMKTMYSVLGDPLVGSN